MANPGGLEPPAAGLKVPCPADPGFTLGVHDPAFVRRHLFSPCLVHVRGTAPPVRRLSAAAVAFPAHVRIGASWWGRSTGLRPVTAALCR